MSRELVTPQHIQHWLSDRINGDHALLDNGHHQHVSAPVKDKPDAEGCNWRVAAWRNPAGYESVIETAVDEARARFNLE
ncbi:hypothetical protein [Silvimonas iriomotensis]|uniref:Uncharacterized protein n=1 Tax=Silvimonas iriomotensis TaxID=449662 RepID=A0ABQ2P5P9_9NEIS|nr:hypothetical protein [Silvimonas iriomotensis]GGP18793.1 hypothetical protein GCM10010970_07280 [Silvimonas iriomotensis]